MHGFLDEEQEQEEEEELIQQMKAPLTVDTIIPKTNMECTTLLRTMDLYIQSVTDLTAIPNSININNNNQSNLFNETPFSTRTSRRTTRLSDNGIPVHNYYSKASTPESNNISPTTQSELDLPYVPNRAWYNSTWEDWAQLDAGDVLHYPFTDQECEIINQCVIKQNSRQSTAKNRQLVDFWQYVSDFLPGRKPLDCKCFWADHKESANIKLYNKPIIIGRQKRKQNRERMCEKFG